MIKIFKKIREYMVGDYLKELYAIRIVTFEY